MKILVTSGGTQEPIDSVRFIGNRSSGRTGAVLVEQALSRGHAVMHLRAASAVTAAPDKGRERLLEALFSTHAELKASLSLFCQRYRPDVVIHAAAVADFRCAEVLEGKLDSAAELTLRLLPTEKLAPLLRGLLPDARIVVFKLGAGLGLEELFAKARDTLKAASADLVVANFSEAMGDHQAQRAWILDSRDVLSETKTKTELARALLDALGC